MTSDEYPLVNFYIPARAVRHEAPLAVVGIRSFGAETYYWKPAGKLFNTWRAGVPAIPGNDSTYKAQQHSELDYLCVSTLDELDAAPRRLADQPALRRAVVNNGRLRAREVEYDQVVRRWIDVIQSQAVPRSERWCAATPGERAAFVAGLLSPTRGPHL